MESARASLRHAFRLESNLGPPMSITQDAHCWPWMTTFANCRNLTDRSPPILTFEIFTLA